ncbi:hypothetical protein DTO96_100218 [Ephemeroptericola cinctiostellae]|uniref:Damage-inducible protein DinB n=1 Tax=Ephemeroptericola cinctiostellae TaxID=2268024 RepID=A0A345D822_9BURK|nr:DinB family protein [Ephemeroptericola cinctiostellae]AXF84510.1 hypothetical protein DTO96_100218 [Ephemeroptericola cinctiostellae]
MSTSSLLTSLFEYKAWANQELLVGVRDIDAEAHPKMHKLAIRLLNHTHVVDRIFAAHLIGEAHDYTASNTPDTPTLGELAERVRASDAWYIDYIASLTAPQLAESIAFTFTDGQQGRMSREEILAHLITHGGYHRGMIGRMLSELKLKPPRDVFTGYLHHIEIERRRLP